MGIGQEFEGIGCVGTGARIGAEVAVGATMGAGVILGEGTGAVVVGEGATAGAVGTLVVGATTGAGVILATGPGVGALLDWTTVNEIVTLPSNEPPAFVKLCAETVSVCCPSVIFEQVYASDPELPHIK